MARSRFKNIKSLPYAGINRMVKLYGLYTQEGLGIEVRRFIIFCFIGLIGVGVGIGVLWTLTEVVGLFYIISAVIAHILAVTSNFTWNQIWTFRDRSNGSHLPELFKRWLRFLLSTSVALGVNIGMLTLLTEVIGIYYIVSALCAIVVATPVNFLLSTFWVWNLSSKKSKSA